MNPNTQIKVEQALDKAVELGNVQEACDVVELPRRTFYDNISAPKLAQLRTQKLMKFIDKTEPLLDKILEAIKIQSDDPTVLSKRNKLTELTQAVVNLKKSMDTAVNVINILVKNDNSTTVNNFPTPTKEIIFRDMPGLLDKVGISKEEMIEYLQSL